MCEDHGSLPPFRFFPLFFCSAGEGQTETSDRRVGQWGEGDELEKINHIRSVMQGSKNTTNMI